MVASFKGYADLAMASPAVAGLRPVIEKELLHYEILNAMMLEGLLKDIVFQGGTSLRLCHGAVRYSEDLDFSGGPGFTAERAGDIAGALRHHISDHYGLPVSVVPPKERSVAGSDPVRVSSWSIRVETSPGGRNMPSQKIKIDIDTSVSHSVERKNLQLNYDFLPSGYGDLIIPAQSLAEVMANKLVALPSSMQQRNRPRYRDIWDLRWMSQRNVTPDIAMIKAKAEEHASIDYKEQIEQAIARIDDTIHSEGFIGEMGRFLPSDVREGSIDRPGWLDVAGKTVGQLLRTVRDGLHGGPGGTGFEF